MMNDRWNRSGLAAAALLLLVASLASAKFPSLGKSTVKLVDLEITSAIRVGSGPELQPGSYKVSLVNSSGSPEGIATSQPCQPDPGEPACGIAATGFSASSWARSIQRNV